MSTAREVTRGLRLLQDRGVAYEVVPYLYKRKGAGRAADAVGWAERQTITSLVVQTGAKELTFALVPADRDLSTRKLGRLLGVKTVNMASVNEAERRTGYKEGGISPLGSYAALPVVLEETLLAHDRVLINAGRRGVLVSLSPWDLQELLQAEVADIVA